MGMETVSKTVTTAGHVRDVSRPVSPLEADVRRPGRDALDGRAGGRRTLARLPAQAELLRSRRRHRAGGRDSADPLRAPRSPRGRHHQPEGAHLLRRREHLHAARLDPRVEGQLLQVHERDAAGDGRRQRALRAQVPRGAERHLRRRRLRAGAGLRRDLPRRRRQLGASACRRRRCSACCPAPAA